MTMTTKLGGLLMALSVRAFSPRSLGPVTTTRLFLFDASSEFRPGDRIQIEVVSFGPLGASVDVIGIGHDPDQLIPESEPPLGQGLVLQKEIAYFRQGRDNVDIVRGEVLPAFVEKVREDGKIDISLRSFGGKAKTEEVSKLILAKLDQDGRLEVGDKSTPEEIAEAFPGVSKGSFKKAVAALYRQGRVKPGPTSVTLME